MPDRVDAAMDRVKATGPHPVAHVVLAEARRAKLRNRDHTVLARGDFGDEQIGLGELVADIATKSPSTATSPPAAAKLAAFCVSRGAG